MTTLLPVAYNTKHLYIIQIIVLYYTVLYLYIYMALFVVHTNQKRLLALRETQREQSSRERKKGETLLTSYRH